MTDTEVFLFRGKNINDMTKEELIEALKFMGKQYNAVLASALKMNETWSELCKAMTK